MTEAARPIRTGVPTPVIRNYRFSHVADVIAEAGHDPRRVLRGRGLPRRGDMGEMVTLPVRQMVELLEHAATVTGLDDLGLRVGARYHPGDWGVYGYIFLNSPTILQALKSWVAVTRIEQQGSHAQLIESKEGVRLEYAIVEPIMRRRRQDAEMTIAVILQAIRILAGHSTVPLDVCFEHASPQNIAPHRRFFRAPIDFSMGVNAVTLERDIVLRPIPNADPQLLKVLHNFVAQTAEEEEATHDFRRTVEFEIRALLPSGKAGLEDVARRFGMSPRSVQRGLEELGLSYQDCLDHVRLTLAEDLLARPDMEIKEIAFMLGYSGNAAFTRAFRRWKGASPLATRRGLA